MKLSTPTELPDADVVIYDGQCNICRGQVERLARFDGAGRLAYLSLHDDEVGRRYPDLEHEALMQQMVVVDRHGTRHWGAEAVRYLSCRLPRLWWLAPVLHIPGTLALWKALYGLIARNRYRWGGRAACDHGSCRI